MHLLCSNGHYHHRVEVSWSVQTWDYNNSFKLIAEIKKKISELIPQQQQKRELRQKAEKIVNYDIYYVFTFKLT